VLLRRSGEFYRRVRVQSSKFANGRRMRPTRVWPLGIVAIWKESMTGVAR
jgi:hypothetical protein